MKSIKNSSLVKLVAFFILAVILSCTVAYAAQDIQAPHQPKPDDNGKTEDVNQPNGNTDENTDGNNNQIIPTVKPTPEFLYYLTGLEAKKEDIYKRPLCFVFDSQVPQYSLSRAALVVELPTEYGQTRFAAIYK